jgi:hypothetical protein
MSDVTPAILWDDQEASRNKHNLKTPLVATYIKSNNQVPAYSTPCMFVRGHGVFYL